MESAPEFKVERITAAGTLTDRVFEALKQLINGEDFQPGSRLPSELKMASRFGVSRTVIREAVSRLKSEGLVESRQGSGVFVRERNMHAPFRIDPSIMDSIQSVLQVVELRLSLEGEIAALAARRREIAQLALLFVDIDRFKPINDMLGHAIGDLLLKEIADRIRLAVRGSDIPARIGGDEFVVLLPVISQREDALTVAEKIRVSIMKPFAIEGHQLAVSASIGIAIFPDDGSELIELAKHADKAMYVAKEQGRNAVLFYSPNLESTADNACAKKTS